MKIVKTLEAVNHILCNDLTRIVKGEVKEVAFRKGHVIKEIDIPLLLSMGKEHLYVWEKQEGMLHENDAALLLSDICKNKNIKSSEIKEGKVEIIADCDGLFQVDVKKLLEINMLDEIIIASRHTNYPVKKHDKLAGVKIIPLTISEDKIDKVKLIVGSEPIFQLLNYNKMKVGIITTGSEVFHKRIKDTFTSVIVEKIEKYNLEVCKHIIVDDKIEMLIKAIEEVRNSGAQLIICTGGMSVDPDDITPTAIKQSGANIVTYGVPVLPGSMFLLAYFEDKTPLLGLPACVMYDSTTIFDLILPRICAGVEIDKKSLAKLGHGGLCFKCENCFYPHCEFGKGA